MRTAPEPFGTIRDRAVYLAAADTLVVADLHLGMASASAVEAPLDEGAAMVDQLGPLIDRFEPGTVVLAGDVLHAFGSVPRSARATLDALDRLIATADASLVLLAGNHDAQLAALADEPPADAHLLSDGTVVCHGHERPPEAGRRYVVGHDHPVIEIEGRRRPCFLHGPAAFDGADVLALPAFNPAVRGTTINALTDGDPLSPFLAEVTRFHPVVWDAGSPEPLVFPALADLRSYL